MCIRDFVCKGGEHLKRTGTLGGVSKSGGTSFPYCETKKRKEKKTSFGFKA